MKIKDLMETLKKYDPEDEFVIALPPNWYRDEDVEDIGVWEKEGWTFDSADYVVYVEDLNFVCVCPLKDPGFESGTLK